LRELHGPALTIQILTVKTRGDRVQEVPIDQIGGKGVFVKEIEQALLAGDADFGVHSLKDMPAELPPGLVIAAIPEREDPADALVFPRSGVQAFRCSGLQDRPGGGHSSEHPNASPLAALPKGAAVGTTSRRRAALLLHERPDLRIGMLRGNLDTRLHKLDIGQHDAVILAAAGLRRLGFADRISQLLPVDHFVPCAGQGALAIEARADNRRVRDLLAPLEHLPSARCVAAERVVLRRMGASCRCACMACWPLWTALSSCVSPPTLPPVMPNPPAIVSPISSSKPAVIVSWPAYWIRRRMGESVDSCPLRHRNRVPGRSRPG
jgi:hydroxymethylbilane synthase